MCNNSFLWTAESHALLQLETRRQKFDFEKVSVIIRNHYNDQLTYLTAKDCRLAYATEYIAQPIIEEEAEAIQNIDDSMSFNQIMEMVEIRNERSEKRKEKIFNRVLASLGWCMCLSVCLFFLFVCLSYSGVTISYYHTNLVL